MSEASDEVPRPTRRPIERESLYNPAFIALIIAQAVAGYEARTTRGMPVSLVFLAVPVALHGPTREALPRQARSKMATWLEDNPLLRAGLAPRARSIADEVRAGLRRGLHSGVVTLENSTLSSARPSLKGKDIELSTEVTRIMNRAKFVGGWFGTSGPPAGIYALWRVRP
jgi:hypothetical protein